MKTALVFLFSWSVLAESEGFPAQEIFFQSLNFFVFFFLFILFLRKPIKTFYGNRRKSFIFKESVAKKEEQKKQ